MPGQATAGVIGSLLQRTDGQLGLSHVIGQDEVTGRIEELVDSNAHANPEAPWSYHSETWEGKGLFCSFRCSPVADILLI